MGVVKQLLFSLLVLVAAFAAWVRWAPDAGQSLLDWGAKPEWVALIAPEQPPETAARPAGGGRQGSGSGGGPGGGGRGGPQPAVIAQPVGQATINDQLQAIGTGQAIASVTVQPYAAGRITSLDVKSGQRVEEGAVLATLDAEAEEIALDRARIARDDAEARVGRISALRRSNTASAVEQTEAELALRNAELAVRDAELALERRSIMSPIGGVVGIVPVELGDRVTAETTIAAVDDRSSIVVDFWVPERFASVIEVGAPLTAEAVARAGDAFEGTVSAVDNRIDQASRTLQVQARIDNPNDMLRAGQSFRVAMRFPGQTYPAVDPLAVQWGAEGAFVWAVRDGKGQRVAVRIVQRNTESVLVDAQLGAGDLVVTEGVHAVREGGDVQIAQAVAQPKPAPLPVSTAPAAAEPTASRL